MNSQRKESLKELAEAISDAASMVTRLSNQNSSTSVAVRESLPSLLEQCRALSDQVSTLSEEPIRTVHHLACTGGTLISRCLASMPNTFLLSEVEPFSRLAHGSGGRFFPTDLIRLVKVGSREVGDKLLEEIFHRGLRAIYEDCQVKGLRLVLRDHAHSHFCVGNSIEQLPCLKELVEGRYRVLSIVTVRHPVESYLSLAKNGWRHFTPSGMNEYCSRYLAFLDKHNSAPVFRYEDFVDSPIETMRSMVHELELPLLSEFQELFQAIQLSGDSGRRGGPIQRRTRREVSETMQVEFEGSPLLRVLCERLGYELDLQQLR